MDEAPWAHTHLDMKPAGATSFGKKRFDRPQTAFSAEGVERKGGVRAGMYSSYNSGRGAVPWGIDL